MNESYAACFYLEVSAPPHNKPDKVNNKKANIIRLDMFSLSSCQSQFKSQGNKLIPDSPAEQALMYQRMFEGLTFYEKLSKTNEIP